MFRSCICLCLNYDDDDSVDIDSKKNKSRNRHLEKPPRVLLILRNNTASQNSKPHLALAIYYNAENADAYSSINVLPADALNKSKSEILILGKTVLLLTH